MPTVARCHRWANGYTGRKGHMTNEEIIARKAISEGLFTEEEIIRRIKNDIDIPLHTSRGWKERGYTVKKGEKGVICRLWKRRDSTSEQTQFYQTKSPLFREDQVEKGGT